MLENTLDLPIYSIKAVAHMAGITEPTLRAWEKRYKILTPQRTESGHRRYTKRDIYRVMWLRNRLEEGMSISQASTLLQAQPEETVLEVMQYENRQARSNSTKTNGRGSHPKNTRLNEVRSMSVLGNELMNAFLQFDEQTADNLISEAAGFYPPEEVCVDLIQPVLYEIGDRWMRNEVTVATEHFASNICRTRLNAMINSLPVLETGPLILTGCAPHEFHEVGVVMTTFFLRRNGWRVLYLGQNVPALDLEKDLRRLKPAMVVFSASRSETAIALHQEISPVIEKVKQYWLPGIIFAYAGRAFTEDPNLHALFKNAVYFGDEGRQSVALVEKVLSKD
ncbi:MAG: MerR family transcriptional regulator [Chloroflexi bacterium]|uniref:MerR family transcriptional regulator n=1 Tax=Candidatus Chlorohelix allophototropha TaxID=3003348 RepID=A0A8T7LUZ0_9CHLR|nr:MerR family transcriptional regulator [Chloroflexota bacterium]WJW66565.1 MerR family transcriptional regulator [Chloroflexota bacterium L227-S17]